MGSFKGHVLPGSLFLLVGVWHIWSSVVRYVSEPAGSFRVRAWCPMGQGKTRYLELYFVAGGAFLDMCVELLYSTHLHWFVGPERILNPSHLNDFEHGGMLLMFFLYGAIALLSEKTRMILDNLKGLMNSNLSTTPRARKDVITAQYWAVLSGATGLEDLERLTSEIMFKFPRTMDINHQWAKEVYDIHHAQTPKAIEEVGKLLAMAYLQKARMEQAATKDNWASDALGPIEHHIKNLVQCHKSLCNSRQSNIY